MRSSQALMEGERVLLPTASLLTGTLGVMSGSRYSGEHAMRVCFRKSKGPFPNDRPDRNRPRTEYIGVGLRVSG